MRKDFFSEESIRETLASFDAEEAKMQRSLEQYRTNGPAHLYKFLSKEYARSLAQMNVRRKLLRSLLPQPPQVDNVKPII